MSKEELNEQLYKAVENGDLEDVIEALKAGAECTRDISSFCRSSPK